ncbi:MAG: type I DNA topoisomerase [Bacteroidales bacterium]|nr:type I DNA topoisomerase [Bacteroidales bacterium]
MKGNLVIVESPTKAKKIQGYLGKEYTVKSSQGHIRDLPDKSLSIDIDHGFKPNYVIPADKKKIVSELKELASKADMVWLASDEDREGEAISWHLAETLGLDSSKTKRIVFHEITKPAILEAVQNPRNIDMNLVSAQQARRIMDRLVGFELSPVLWKKIQPKLSAGRVQSVALRLVVDREREISAFNAEQFYRVEAIFIPEGSSQAVKAVLDTRFSSEADAYAFLEKSIGAQYHVGDINSKEGVRTPAAPFTTSSLQQEAARKLGFSVSQTMQVAQKLYEEGLITYMRTDSTNLSSLAINTAKKFICDNFGEEYSKSRQYKTKTKGAQEAHEAIRPTYIENTEIKGTSAEMRLYNLIWKRTVASQMADAKVLNTSIEILSGNFAEKYCSEASKVLFDGFLKLYMESSDDESADSGEVILPDIHSGTIMHENGISALCKFTQAPLRYSQASLVKKLEELQIGRPSTYASIISTLIKGRGYIVEGDKEGKEISIHNLSLKDGRISVSTKTEKLGAEKRKLLPQDIGMMVTDYLVENFADVLDYGFTAGVEESFDLIAEGKMTWEQVISDFYAPFHEGVQRSLTQTNYSRLEREIGIDPADGQKITAKYGQFGPYVQKGEGENRVFASLAKGQIIENLTLEDAIALLQLPRTLGQIDGTDVTILKGRFGPYIKFGDRNVAVAKGTDPLKITLEQAQAMISDALNKPASKVIAQWEGIQVLEGAYGPYIKANGANYKLPKGTDAYSLKEEEAKNIIENSQPTSKKRGGFKKK